MIELTNLRVLRRGQTLCNIERFSVSRGEKVAVIGPNGSGKTTMLRVLAGLITRFHGECHVDAVGSDRTFVHQRPYLFRGTVLANVCYGLRPRVATRKRRHAEAMQLLDRLEVGHLAKRTTQNLSGGEIRRVALARALACDVQLLLLDEPLAELDPDAAGLVCRVIGELEDVTVVVASPGTLAGGEGNEGAGGEEKGGPGRGRPGSLVSREFQLTNPVTASA